MTKKQAGSVLHYLNQVIGTPVPSADSDAILLERFALRRDETAFAELVRRHGRLVWNVCRRLLGHDQDAEDAFQATFLILADKAAAIHKRRSLASWLYGVATRTAWNARKKVRRRRYHEQHVEERSNESPANIASLRELQTILDEEVRRLPEKFQAPFVLCCLEGKGRTEAARLLGWKEGTVSSRLAQARERLQKRLSHRGVALSAALCASVLSPDVAPAALPVALGTAAGKIAAGVVSERAMILARGVLKSMFMAKLKAGAALVLVLGGLAAGGTAALQKNADNQPQPPMQAASNPEEQRRVNADLHGDPLPPGVVARLGTLRFRAGGRIQKLVFAPDGKTIASSSNDNVVRLWDAASGKVVREVTEPCFFNPFTLAFSPNGKILASASEFLDVASGKVIGRCTPTVVDVNSGMVEPVAGETCAAFSPYGKYFATGHTDKTARLWDVASGKQLRKFDVCRNNWVACIAFSPDGKTLATGGRTEEHALRLWDVATGAERYGVRGHRRNETEKMGGVGSLAFAPDGKTLATVGSLESGDTVVRLWDAATGKELRQFHGHTDTPGSLAFSPDGKQLVTGGPGRWYPAKEHTARVWDVASGRELLQLKGHQERVMGVAFSLDGKTIATGGSDSCILLWDARTGKPAGFRSGPQGAVHSIAIAPDGEKIFTRTEKATHLWQTTTGKAAGQLPGGTGGIALTPDGRLLASAEYDGVIRLWDVSTSREKRQLKGHRGEVKCVSFSPDGKYLVSGGRDGTTRLWDVADGKERRQMIGLQPGLPPKPIRGMVMALVNPGDTPSVSCVVFSPDGKTIASGHSDNTVRLWEAATGKQIQQLAEQGSVTAVAYSPDGRMLASAGGLDNKLRIWEIASGKIRQEIVHFERVVALAFSPDGWTLASSTSDRIAETYLWDVRTGKLWGRLCGHRGPVVSLAYSRDGKRLATGSEDTTVLLWDMSALTPERRRQMLSLPLSELEELWRQMSMTFYIGGLEELRRDIGMNAYYGGSGITREIWRLSTAPEQSVSFLAQHLRPRILDMQKINQWIKEIKSADGNGIVRGFENLFGIGAAKAFNNLLPIVVAAKPLLSEALKDKPTSQGREWIEQLLAFHASLSGEEMRELQAVEVLRLIDSDESRALLKKLAGGTPCAPLTRVAADALKRGTR